MAKRSSKQTGVTVEVVSISPPTTCKRCNRQVRYARTYMSTEFVCEDEVRPGVTTWQIADHMYHCPATQGHRTHEDTPPPSSS